MVCLSWASASEDSGYLPITFTLQGASWVKMTANLLGVTWGTDAEKRKVGTGFAGVEEWSRAHSRPGRPRSTRSGRLSNRLSLDRAALGKWRVWKEHDLDKVQNRAPSGEFVRRPGIVAPSGRTEDEEDQQVTCSIALVLSRSSFFSASIA
jgi:hypothetical protein